MGCLYGANLARAGAFDGLAGNRAQVLEAVDLMLRFANRAAEDRESQQTSLFADANGDDTQPVDRAATDTTGSSRNG